MADIPALFAEYIFIPDRIPYAVLALALCAVAGVITGPLKGLATPALWIFFNKTLGGMGQRLDRRERSRKDLIVRGVIFTVMVFILACGAALGSYYYIPALPLGRWIEVLLLSFSIASGSVAYLLLKLYQAQHKSLANRTYFTLAQTSQSDFSGSDSYRINRAGMELAAFSFDRNIVAPIFWYLVGGLPAAWLWSGLSWLSWRFGRYGGNKGFAAPALVLEKLFGFLPSLLAGLFIACGALFTPTGKIVTGLMAVLDGNKRTGYSQGGPALSAMAYSLNVSFGGPFVNLDGETIKRPWIGPPEATAQLGNHHLRRALYITLMAYLLFGTSLMGVFIWY